MVRTNRFDESLAHWDEADWHEDETVQVSNQHKPITNVETVQMPGLDVAVYKKVSVKTHEVLFINNFLILISKYMRSQI